PVAVGDPHPQVAWEGQDDRLLEGRVRVYEHDGVGAVASTDVLIGAELVLLVDRESRARVRSEQEIVARPVRTFVGRVGRGTDPRGASEGIVRPDVPQLNPPDRARSADDADD